MPEEYCEECGRANCICERHPMDEEPMDTDCIEDHMPAEYFTESEW